MICLGLLSTKHCFKWSIRGFQQLCKDTGVALGMVGVFISSTNRNQNTRISCTVLFLPNDAGLPLAMSDQGQRG